MRWLRLPRSIATTIAAALTAALAAAALAAAALAAALAAAPFSASTLTASFATAADALRQHLHSPGQQRCMPGRWRRLALRPLQCRTAVRVRYRLRRLWQALQVASRSPFAAATFASTAIAASPLAAATLTSPTLATTTTITAATLASAALAPALPAWRELQDPRTHDHDPLAKRRGH